MTTWTNEQQKAIETRGKNIIVSASAGSGKTTVMVERILSIVKDGASLERMLISTFTKSSAADMREKMFNILSASAQNEHIKRQLEILPQADVTNLHSWYQRIIKKYFYALGIDPAFEILEEDEARIILSACLDEVIENNLNYGSEDFRKLYEYLRVSRKDSNLRSYILKIYDFAMTRSDPDEWLTRAPRDCPERRRAILEEAYNAERAELIAKAENLLRDTVAANFKRNIQAAEELKVFLEYKTDMLMKLGGKIPTEFIELNERYKTLKARVVEWRRSFDELFALPRNCLLNFKAEMIRLTMELKESYALEKASRSLMDFNDLEQNCAKLLSISSVGDEIIDSYDFVFVDEYQDINPLQERILNYLARKSEMFYVGDVKQSIYAFRGCEPAIFLDRYESYKNGDGGIAIDFNDNFRSFKEITDFCNGVMSPLMTKECGGTDYARDAMLKSSKGEGGSVSAYILAPETAEEISEQRTYDILTDTAQKTSDAQAEAAANHILNLIKKGVKYGEIAVLVRGASGSLECLKKELSERGIPYVSGGGKSFCSRAEIMPVISFMKLLDNFRDEVNLVAVMRSVFGGFSDDELATTALLQGKNFYEKTRDFSSLHIGKKLRKFWTEVEDYYEFSRFHTVYETVNRLIYEHDYFKYLFASSDRDAPDALNAFLEHLSKCKYAGSINEYLTYIKSSSPSYEPSDRSDAVNIMTVHKSKGLEFPHVVFFNTSHRFSTKDYSQPLIIDDEGIHLKNWNEDKREVEDTVDWRAALIVMEKRQREEELRLLYVALTRAKDSLAIFGKGNKAFFDDFREPKVYSECVSALDFLSVSVRKATRPLSEISAENSGSDRVLLLQKTDDGLADALRQRWAYVSPYARHKLKSYVTKISETLAPYKKPENSAFRTEFSYDESALQTGTLYHKIMESMDFSREFTSQWAEVTKENPEFSDRDSIEAAFRNIKNLTEGKKYYKELPFTFNASSEYVGESGGNVIVQGVIDLLIDNGDSFTVVDYKTTREEDILNEAYKIQLKLYGEAAEKILGKKVTKKYIYSFRLKKLFEI